MGVNGIRYRRQFDYVLFPQLPNGQGIVARRERDAGALHVKGQENAAVCLRWVSP
jgi:hypothetical protein